jgi:NAD(P)-dependent dehydrogenase (short-subunit alcohol dehydrogenase family)
MKRKNFSGMRRVAPLKKILITGATDGIGLKTAKVLAAPGHTLLIHGRNPAKLERAVQDVAALTGAGPIEPHLADLARISEVEALAESVKARHGTLDVLINNAGVYKTPDPVTQDGLDVRFVVNTIAPYLLTQRLLPAMRPSGRVVNVTSAAQAPVNLEALAGRVRLDDMAAYAQSKLGLVMWSRVIALKRIKGPIVIAVNPGSLLASKMVRDGFGVAGSDLGIGADILARAALSDEFAHASGKYFDNDIGQFAPLHADARDVRKCDRLAEAIEKILS